MPPKRFFAGEEVAQAGGIVSNGRLPGYVDTYSTYENQYFDADGYLIREVKVGSVVVQCKEGEGPTLEELQEFRKKGRGGDDGEVREATS